MMASRFRKVGVALWIAFFVVVAFMVLSPKNESPAHEVPVQSERQEKPQQAEAGTPVNFTVPLYTKPAALVCPIAVSFDPREGHGLNEAMDAHLSIFGHEDAITKSGCEEWREGIPISLTDEGRKQAAELGANKLCSMVRFTDGYIFSCDLRNSTKEEHDLAALEHARQEIATAMQDPSKVRLMECMGMNPWQEKPAGWTPPTDEECAALKQRLGAAADIKEAVPDAPSEDVESLIAEEENLNDKCRNGSGDDKATLEICDKRDAMLEKIRAKNWCWGHDGQIEADKTWEPCPRASQ